MRVTFVNSQKDMYPPIGICYLSAYLKKYRKDVTVNLIELARGENPHQALKKIIATRPDIVGFTTYTVGICEVIFLSQFLKNEEPGIVVIWGGPHITSLPSTLPSCVDAGIIGEGEQTFFEFCEQFISNRRLCRESLSQIKGLCFHMGEGVVITPPRPYLESLDDIAAPDISLLDMGWYTALKRFLVMSGNYRGFILLTSRGCPYHCRFCQAAKHWGMIRYHSAERVVYEIANLRNRHPHINAINIIDDLFIADRGRLRDIVQLIRGSHLHDGIVFNVNGRANIVDEEILDLLKSMNVVQISYGFESGSERILNFLKRGSVELWQNKRAASLTNQYGIGVGGQFMIGAPDETEEEIRQTIDFIASHKMSHAHLSVTIPLPGTELWEICKQKGLVSETTDWKKLDFGNPRNPDLLYIDESIPRKRFKYLLRLAQKACDKWNHPRTVRDYIELIRVHSGIEFIKGLFREVLYKIHGVFTR